jgi:hypothetical protein
VGFFRLTLNTGVATTQQQTTWGTNACANQPEIGRGIE